MKCTGIFSFYFKKSKAKLRNMKVSSYSHRKTCDLLAAFFWIYMKKHVEDG